MKFYINIEYENNIYTLFLIGYTSDGGFFIKDLINNGKSFLIGIESIPYMIMRKAGSFALPLDKIEFWESNNSPKLTYHKDGTLHVSGGGVFSGKYKFFPNTKGASTKNMSLEENNNDGGPIIGFYIPKVNDLPIKKKEENSILVRKKDQIIDWRYEKLDSEKYGIELEIFYISKAKTNNLKKGDNIPFPYRGIGTVPLKYIPTPKKSPGSLGIVTRKFKKYKDNSNYIFTLNGGASPISKDGTFKNITIFYPHDEESKKFYEDQKIRNLDYRGINKIKVKIDLFFEKIKDSFNFLGQN